MIFIRVADNASMITKILFQFKLGNIRTEEIPSFQPLSSRDNHIFLSAKNVVYCNIVLSTYLKMNAFILNLTLNKIPKLSFDLDDMACDLIFNILIYKLIYSKEYFLLFTHFFFS